MGKALEDFVYEYIAEYQKATGMDVLVSKGGSWYRLEFQRGHTMNCRRKQIIDMTAMLRFRNAAKQQ